MEKIQVATRPEKYLEVHNRPSVVLSDSGVRVRHYMSTSGPLTGSTTEGLADTRSGGRLLPFV